MHLIHLDLGVLMRAIEKDEAGRVAVGFGRRYGCVPPLASATWVSARHHHSVRGSALRRSCCWASAGGACQMISLLRVNRKFMMHMYKSHSDLLR